MRATRARSIRHRSIRKAQSPRRPGGWGRTGQRIMLRCGAAGRRCWWSPEAAIYVRRSASEIGQRRDKSRPTGSPPRFCCSGAVEGAVYRKDDQQPDVLPSAIRPTAKRDPPRPDRMDTAAPLPRKQTFERDPISAAVGRSGPCATRHAFVQNLGRGRYDLTTEPDIRNRLGRRALNAPLSSDLDQDLHRVRSGGSVPTRDSAVEHVVWWHTSPLVRFAEHLGFAVSVTDSRLRGQQQGT